jgi:hypothetical protein
MNKILKLMVDDYQNNKPSAEYRLALRYFCDAEKRFMSMLNKKQAAEYLKLSSMHCELDSIGLDDFAVFLFNQLRTHLK